MLIPQELQLSRFRASEPRPYERNDSIIHVLTPIICRSKGLTFSKELLHLPDDSG